jgi:DNA helicase HerA-like ATPase
MLGTITGKTTPTQFSFDVDDSVQNLEYVKVYHGEQGYVLCQVIDVEKEEESTTATCNVIGYRDEGTLKVPRTPFDPDTEVLLADDEFIAETIQIDDSKRGGHLGTLSGRNIPVNLDLNKVLTKHMSVLAKSGSGKSYTVGVLLEEIMEKGIPVLVIDPHGEYGSLKRPNPDQEAAETLKQFGLTTNGYDVVEWGDPDVVDGARRLRIPHDFSSRETTEILPKSPTGAQRAVLYNALKKMDSTDLESLIHTVDLDDSTAKYQLLGMLEHLQSLDIFTEQKFDYQQFIEPGTCNILNFKGLEPYVQELVVYKVVKELFQHRKEKSVPPFFLVVEEAHNYAPERSFGEKQSSDIMRTVASEGRKFGLGLCVVSQRPARVDKNVLSQCSTQVLMKITNPNDLSAVSKSVENLTSATQDEIKNLAVGTGLVTGINEMPLLVDIRPRRSEHGGEADEIFTEASRVGDEDREKELVNVIEPQTSYEEVRLATEDDVRVNIVLHPCKLFTCDESTHILMSEVTGELITDIEQRRRKHLPDPSVFSGDAMDILQALHENTTVSRDEVSSEEALERLVEDEYVDESDDGLSLSDRYVFTDPSHYGFSFLPSYKEVLYDEKRERVFDDLRERLGHYVDVTDERTCYLLQYEYGE